MSKPFDEAVTPHDSHAEVKQHPGVNNVWSGKSRGGIQPGTIPGSEPNHTSIDEAEGTPGSVKVASRNSGFFRG
jgi:hypothetical protein